MSKERKRERKRERRRGGEGDIVDSYQYNFLFSH